MIRGFLLQDFREHSLPFMKSRKGKILLIPQLLYNQYPFRIFRHPETVIATLSYQPYNLACRANHILIFFLEKRKLTICQIIADLLFPFIPKGTNLSPCRHLRTVRGSTTLSASKQAVSLFLGMTKSGIISCVSIASRNGGTFSSTSSSASFLLRIINSVLSRSTSHPAETNLFPTGQTNCGIHLLPGQN